MIMDSVSPPLTLYSEISMYLSTDRLEIEKSVLLGTENFPAVLVNCILELFFTSVNLCL